MLSPLSPVVVLGELAASLRVLPELLAEVARATRVLPPMDERMTHIEEATPSWWRCSGTSRGCPRLEGLNAGMAELVGLMDCLRESLEPLGRLADRVPGGRR